MICWRCKIVGGCILGNKSTEEGGRMKKLLGGFLALILALALLPGTALANGPVAKIESREFDTLTEALGSAVDGETVQLIANTTVTDSLSLT